MSRLFLQSERTFYSLKENHLYLEVIFFIIDGVLQYQGFQGRFQGYG